MYQSDIRLTLTGTFVQCVYSQLFLLRFVKASFYSLQQHGPEKAWKELQDQPRAQPVVSYGVMEKRKICIFCITLHQLTYLLQIHLKALNALSEE